MTELDLNVLRKVIESRIKELESEGLIKLADLFYMQGMLMAYETCSVITYDERIDYEKRMQALKMKKE